MVASESEAAEPSDAAEGLHTRTMLKAARLTIASTAKLAEQVGQMTAALESDRQDRARQTSSLERIAETAERTLAAQLAVNLRCTEIAGSLIAMQDTVQETAGNLTTVIQTHTRSAAATSSVLLQETRLLRDTASLGLDGLQQMQVSTRQLQSGMQELSHEVMQTRRGDQGQTAPGEVASMIAELDHLIAATHLGPRDIRNLRRLSALAEELSEPLGAHTVPQSADAGDVSKSSSNVDQRAAL